MTPPHHRIIFASCALALFAMHQQACLFTSPSTPQDTTQGDMGSVGEDMSAPDLGGEDMSAPEDMRAPDMGAPDMAPPGDMSVTPDMSPPKDMMTCPPRTEELPDLSTLPHGSDMECQTQPCGHVILDECGHPESWCNGGCDPGQSCEVARDDNTRAVCVAPPCECPTPDGTCPDACFCATASDVGDYCDTPTDAHCDGVTINACDPMVSDFVDCAEADCLADPAACPDRPVLCGDVVREDPQSSARAGLAVATAGDWAAVTIGGGVRLLELVDGEWVPRNIIPPHANAQNFGHSLAMDGNVLVIGAPILTEVGQTSLPTGSEHVYVYENNGSGWNPEATLMLQAPAAHQGFGSSVAIHDRVVAVSTPFGSGNKHVYTYEFDIANGGWFEAGRCAPTAQMKDDNTGTVPEGVGRGLSVNGALGVIAFGLAVVGEVGVCARSPAGTWVTRESLSASDAFDTLAQTYNESTAAFGNALAIDRAGGSSRRFNVFIGAPNAQKNGTTSSQRGLIFARQLMVDANGSLEVEADWVSHDGGPGSSFFGQSLALTHSGVLIGAPSSELNNKRSGLIYEYPGAAGTLGKTYTLAPYNLVDGLRFGMVMDTNRANKEILIGLPEANGGQGSYLFVPYPSTLLSR